MNETGIQTDMDVMRYNAVFLFLGFKSRACNRGRTVAIEIPLSHMTFDMSITLTNHVVEKLYSSKRSEVDCETAIAGVS